jgi:flagellar protein FliO/FliZ
MDSLFTFVTLVAIIVIAAGGYYLYMRTRGDTPLFTPKVRRLAFIERAHLDGGRKLLLVRRDDVEHLILVGGPIDLVVETGIKPKGLANGAAAEDSFADAYPRAATSAGWAPPDASLPRDGVGDHGGPSLPLSPGTKEAAEKNGEDRPASAEED